MGRSRLSKKEEEEEEEEENLANQPNPSFLKNIQAHFEALGWVTWWVECTPLAFTDSLTFWGNKFIITCYQVYLIGINPLNG